jgi:hypothetical protein
MHTTAEQRIHAQLKPLADSDLLGQELEAFLCRLILRIRPIAVLSMRVANTPRHSLNRLLRILLHRPLAARKQSLQQEPKPAEDDVVLGDFVAVVPGEPRVNYDGEGDVAEGREGEVDARARGGDVLGSGELDDFPVVRAADDGDAVAGDEEAEDVLGV